MLLSRSMAMRVVIIVGTMRVRVSLGIVCLQLLVLGVVVSMRIIVLTHLGIIVKVFVYWTKSVGRLVASVSDTAILVLVRAVILFRMTWLISSDSGLFFSKERTEIVLRRVVSRVSVIRMDTCVELVNWRI